MLINLRRTLLLLAVLLVGFGGVRVYYHLKQPAARPADAPVLVYYRDGCSYCVLAKELLESKNIGYMSVDLTNNRDLAQKLENQTGQRTVPYIFIGENFVGGYTDLHELASAGKLDKFMNTASTISK